MALWQVLQHCNNKEEARGASQVHKVLCDISCVALIIVEERKTLLVQCESSASSAHTDCKIWYKLMYVDILAILRPNTFFSAEDLLRICKGDTYAHWRQRNSWTKPWNYIFLKTT